MGSCPNRDFGRWEMTGKQGESPQIVVLILGALAAHVQEAVRRGGATQADAANRIDVSPKTLNGFITALKVRNGSLMDNAEVRAELEAFGGQILEIANGLQVLAQRRTVHVAMTSHISTNYFSKMMD